MLKRVLLGKWQVLVCGSCMEARGLGDAAIMPGARRSTMDELAGFVFEAEKSLVF